MRIQLLDPSDVESLLAFLTRAGVSACRVADVLVEVEGERYEVELLLAIWQAMHPPAGFVWA